MAYLPVSSKLAKEPTIPVFVVFKTMRYLIHKISDRNLLEMWHDWTGQNCISADRQNEKNSDRIRRGLFSRWRKM